MGPADIGQTIEHRAGVTGSKPSLLLLQVEADKQTCAQLQVLQVIHPSPSIPTTLLFPAFPPYLLSHVRGRSRRDRETNMYPAAERGQGIDPRTGVTSQPILRSKEGHIAIHRG